MTRRAIAAYALGIMSGAFLAAGLTASHHPEQPVCRIVPVVERGWLR